MARRLLAVNDVELIGDDCPARETEEVSIRLLVGLFELVLKGLVGGGTQKDAHLLNYIISLYLGIPYILCCF
jgi:hypothetical protein